MASTPRAAAPRAENDIYTMLSLVSFVFLLIATVYVCYRATVLFGSLLPPAGS